MAVKRRRLTDANVAKLAPADLEHTAGDTRLAVLCVRVRPSGTPELRVLPEGRWRRAQDPTFQKIEQTIKEHLCLGQHVVSFNLGRKCPVYGLRSPQSNSISVYLKHVLIVERPKTNLEWTNI